MVQPQDPGMTQALVLGASGLIMLVILNFCLGIVVDFFTDFASLLEIQNLTLRECMGTIMSFSQWFYWIINIMMVLFCAYPIIFIIFRHRYSEVQIQDQQIQQ